LIPIIIKAEDIPDTWLEGAKRLTEALVACQDDDDSIPEDKWKTAAQKRRDVIDKNSGMWTELRSILLRWSYGKCWYSELKDQGSDYHVDHFRPKNRVRSEGMPDRDGYWWLAFDWTNYRMAVSWVNSLHGSEEGPARGKADFFPLAAGTSPVTGPQGDLNSEVFVFLDPIDPMDVLLLDYDETGLPVPTDDGWNAERAMQTRKLLHLDAPRMIDARQGVWRDCEALIALAANGMGISGEEYRARDADTARRAILMICKMLRPDAQLSAVATACVMKSRHRWARKLPSSPLAQIQAEGGF
jgi:hypothetical protein